MYLLSPFHSRGANYPEGSLPVSVYASIRLGMAETTAAWMESAASKAKLVSGLNAAASLHK